MNHTNDMNMVKTNNTHLQKKYKALSNAPDNALNAICPYYTMFPLEYPLKALKKHKKDAPLTVDPFCGRGTTLYAARKMQLNAWGVDTSPIAVAVAKAKLAVCDFEEPILLARDILEAIEPANIPETPFFMAAYHPTVLREICALREGLQQLENESNASVILKAAILGCLHGPLSKHIESAGYFSNQMPRTYASKPDYAVRYWEMHNLQAPKIDVIGVLKRKIHRLVGLPDRYPDRITQVILGDSQDSRTFDVMPSDISLVITSPPYYGMRTYVQDQWLRNWFLGGPDSVDYSNGPQLCHGSQESFAKSLGNVWRNISDKAPNSLHMYVRFGIIPSEKVRAKELFYASTEVSGVQWREITAKSAKSASAGKRQADQMKSGAPNAAVEYDFHLERI